MRLQLMPSNSTDWVLFEKPFNQVVEIIGKVGKLHNRLFSDRLEHSLER